jgi:cell division protein FtsW (lipid II flippase)
VSARWRDLLTVALAISAGVHAALVPEHWRERPLLGLGFVTAAAALAVAVVWVQAAPSRLAARFALVLLAGLTVLYLASRMHGLPVTGHEEWDVVGVATQVVQLAGIALAAVLVRSSERPVPVLGTRGGAHANPTHA